MGHLNLAGRRRNRLRLNVHWIEDLMKIVVVEPVDDGEKITFQMEIVYFLSGERIQLVTWGTQLNMLGL